MAHVIQLAISTCPNDTFAFHAILERRIDLHGLAFEIHLMDIEQLNQGFSRGDFDVCKVSFVAAMAEAARCVVMPAGAALGFGVGPVLLANRPATLESLAERARATGPIEVACPGQWTTATFLCQTLLPFSIVPRQMPFSEIMPAVAAGQVPLGVCIHEGRFTWQDRGLAWVADLGTLWETRTGSPLPLGGIVARRDLGTALLSQVATVIRASVEFGLAHREETLPTLRRYAQEFTDEVLLQHVDLYVNAWTVDLGTAGRNALRTMQAFATKVYPEWSAPLEVLDLPPMRGD